MIGIKIAVTDGTVAGFIYIKYHARNQLSWGIRNIFHSLCNCLKTSQLPLSLFTTWFADKIDLFGQNVAPEPDQFVCSQRDINCTVSVEQVPFFEQRGCCAWRINQTLPA